MKKYVLIYFVQHSGNTFGQQLLVCISHFEYNISITNDLLLFIMNGTQYKNAFNADYAIERSILI